MEIIGNSKVPTIMGDFFQVVGKEMFSLNLSYVSNNYQTPAGDDLSLYQVPAGKKLRIVGIEVSKIHSSGGVQSIFFGYGDTAANSTTPTNPVQSFISTFVGSGGGEKNLYLNYIVPAGKYPFFRTNVAGFKIWGTVFCYLEDE